MDYKGQQRWKSMHVNICVNDLDNLPDIVCTQLKEGIRPHDLRTQWLKINILDMHIISSTYHPIKRSTYLDLFVIVVDETT